MEMFQFFRFSKSRLLKPRKTVEIVVLFSVKNSGTTLERIPPHVQLFKPVSQIVWSSAHTDLMKDGIRRKSASARRLHKPKEDAHLAFAARAFSVMVLVAMVESLQERTKFKVPSIPRSPPNWSDHANQWVRVSTFRRK